MTNIIQHKGVVESINGVHIRVRIFQTSACSACNAKSYCSSSESKEKIIDIYQPAQSIKVGDEVMIYGATSMGLQAVVIAFVIPFVILVSTLFIMMQSAESNELMSALGALAALIPYYLIVYFFRDKLRKNFAFSLKPLK